MNIAVSFDKNSSTEFYEALIERFQRRGTAVYGNNLTHFFPDGPKDFGNFIRMNNALRYPDVILALYSPEYHQNAWLRAELDAFLQLEESVNRDNLVIVIPTGTIDSANLPRWYRDKIVKNVSFQSGIENGMEALAAHLDSVFGRRANISEETDATSELSPVEDLENTLIPATDRYVSISHNQDLADQAVGAVERAQLIVRGSNHLESDVRESIETDVSNGLTLLKTVRRVAVRTLKDLIFNPLKRAFESAIEDGMRQVILGALAALVAFILQAL